MSDSEQTVVKTTASIFVGVMGAVGALIAVMAWIASEKLKPFIKDESKEDDFVRSMTIISVMGGALMSVAISYWLFKGTCGEDNMNSAGGNQVFHGLCAIISFVLMVLGSVALSTIDTEKLVRNKDGEEKLAEPWPLWVLIILSVVALVVATLYVFQAPLKAQAASLKEKYSPQSPKDDAGFCFEF